MLEHKELIEVIDTSSGKKMFKIKDKDTGKFYIEYILPKDRLPLYQQLQQLDIQIPTIVDLQVEGDDLIVIEDFMPFSTLQQYIDYRKLDHNTIYNIMLELCDILHVLHSQNPPIIHRDIKPDNIFFDGQHIYLTDFDIARYYSKDKAKDTTTLGSIGYAAPEQYGLGQSGVQADIYSTGVLFHYLLAGEFPYNHLYQGKETPIIERCIATSPEKRYQDILELKQAIQDMPNKVQSLQSSLKDWLPPGLRKKNFFINGLFILIYGVLISMAIAGMYTFMPGDELYPYRIIIGVYYNAVLLSIVLFWGNYRNIYQYCLFNKSDSWLVIFIGRILSYLLLQLLMFGFIILIISFF